MHVYLCVRRRQVQCDETTALMSLIDERVSTKVMTSKKGGSHRTKANQCESVCVFLDWPWNVSRRHVRLCQGLC